jgi:ribosomal protein L28
MSTNKLIFGHTWEEIQAGQQKKNLNRSVLQLNTQEHKARIESDIQKFKIPVSADVVKAYQIKLPNGYTLDGTTYRFTE